MRKRFRAHNCVRDVAAAGQVVVAVVAVAAVTDVSGGERAGHHAALLRVPSDAATHKCEIAAQSNHT